MSYKPTITIFFLNPHMTQNLVLTAKQFNKDDQVRLSDYLINECHGNWMLIIKNTDFIYNLYNHEKLYVSSFDKKYQVSFMNRNNQDTEHLMITNYKTY